MKRTGGPGIIPFELAGTPERSHQILDRWGSDGQAAARLSLALDYPSPATYAPFTRWPARRAALTKFVILYAGWAYVLLAKVSTSLERRT